MYIIFIYKHSVKKIKQFFLVTVSVYVNMNHKIKIN